jgi:hypothetical protein
MVQWSIETKQGITSLVAVIINAMFALKLGKKMLWECLEWKDIDFGKEKICSYAVVLSHAFIFPD